MEFRTEIEGRKTFFIVPDASLLPEAYLQDLLSSGYESYIIDDTTHYCPIDAKIRIIIESFPDSILFFFIDSQIEGIDWHRYIALLQQEFGGRILIGVLYRKRTETERRELERFYLMNVGIQCGCIALEYQKSKNFDLIMKVMYANQACGRRKNVRALCDKMSNANFDFGGTHFVGNVSDVSLSHFSFVLPGDRTWPDIPIYEKINNIFVTFNGMHFRTNALLALKREVNGTMLFIFMFLKSTGQNGLDPDIEPRVSEKIYMVVSNKVKSYLRELFDEAAKAYR